MILGAKTTHPNLPNRSSGILMSASPDPASNRESRPGYQSRLVSLYQTLAAEHPRGFYQVCLAVLCERWAAFTLISTAALMLCERFGFPRGDALRVLGIVSAAGYFGSLPGGHLLDKTSSPSRGIGISTLLLLLGYITLSLPFRSTLYAAFGLLIAGHSLYKPSTQRMLAAIYPSGDSRLVGAQILLHIAVNVGAAAGSLSAGLLLRYAGWSITYASAALMMSLGGVLFWQRQVDPSGIKTASVADSNTQVATAALPIPNRVQIIAGLTLAMFLFTLCTTQAEGALLLWAKDRIDRVLFGFEVPISWFVAFPAVLVILLAPVQLALLPKLKQSISLGSLVAIGLLSSALSFAVLLPTTVWSTRVSMTWIAASLTFFVVAELLITPLGLSLLLRNAPARFIGVVTGLWFGAGALGYLIGGEIGALWTRWRSVHVLLLLTALPAVGALILFASARRTESE